LTSLVTGARRFLDALVDALALHVDDFVELLCDVVVHTAEVAVLELLTAPLAQLLQHLAEPHELLVVPVAEPLLHQPSQCGVQVAVIEQVVAHLVEQLLGVEVEPRLRAVPPRVAESIGTLASEPPHRSHATPPLAAATAARSRVAAGPAATMTR
jgi:hypothetical protein